MSGQTSTKTLSEVNLLVIRSYIYRFMAHCFHRPAANNADFVKENMSLPWNEIIDAVPYKNKEELFRRLEGLLERLNQATYTDLAAQHEDCFGHTVSGPVPCYELEYGEEHTHREPQQLSDISSFYRAFGLIIKNDNFERVDHIAVECEFMQFLLFKQAYALSNMDTENVEICRQASLHFLQAHLGRWAPSFSLKLKRHVQQGFFRDLAEFTFYYIVADCEWLGITAGPQDLPIRPVQEKADSGCVSCSLRPATPQ